MANIGLGRACGVLNSMLETHIELEVPIIKSVSYDELETTLTELDTGRISIVELGFHGDFGGSASLVFSPESAAKLATVAAGEEITPTVLSAMHIETLNEIGNIVLNAVMGSFSNMMVSELKYTLPNYSETLSADFGQKIKANKRVIVLLLQTQFSAKEFDIKGHILLLFEVSSFKALVKAVDGLL